MDENLFADAEGNLITNGSIITIDGKSVSSVSSSITSGHTPNGERFIRDIEEKRIGDMLYHNETISYPGTGRATETIAWKLNLAIPGAKPEMITNTTKINEK